MSGLFDERHRQVTIMTVNPGFGGQKFISGNRKISDLAAIKNALNTFSIVVDGGINRENIAEVAWGADI